MFGRVVVEVVVDVDDSMFCFQVELPGVPGLERMKFPSGREVTFRGRCTGVTGAAPLVPPWTSSSMAIRRTWSKSWAASRLESAINFKRATTDPSSAAAWKIRPRGRGGGEERFMVQNVTIPPFVIAELVGLSSVLRSWAF